MTAEFLEGLNVGNSGPQLSQGDIEAFERLYSIAPEGDHRSFMLCHNGGIIWRDGWSFDAGAVSFVSWTEDRKSWMQDRIVFTSSLHKLGPVDDDFENIAYELDMLDEIADFPILPDGALPIGRDPGGHLLLHMTRGPMKGAVMFWDRTVVAGLTEHDLGFIAPSFADFLKALRPEPEDWEELEAEAAERKDPR